MRSGGEAAVKDLVLVGGGHSHVAVLKAFGMRPAPGLRLTLLCRDTHTPYSGMLPGLVAGHYRFDDAHIDLRRLARFAGARFCRDEAVGLDLAARRVLCRDRPPLRYDLLSINIGSTPGTAGVPGAAETAVPVKPIGGFLAHWERLCAAALARPGGLRIGVVGAGAGGVEILLATQYRLGRLLAAAGRQADAPEFHLFAAGDDILPTHNGRVRAIFRHILATRGVVLHLDSAVVAASAAGVATRDGRRVALDEILWATQAAPAPWLAKSGLAVDEEGFAAVDDRLRSLSHPEIFAAGDIATVAGAPRPKSGVFAVRQGPPLARNLRRAGEGRRLLRFRPQRRFLSLVTTGERYAVASRGALALEGPLVWRWKDRIDRRFMARYNDLPAMGTAPAPAIGGSEAAMRCGGCGAKLGADLLAEALARLRPRTGKAVLVGLAAPDDAAVVRLPPGAVSVQSVDFFRAIVDDPFVFGQVAANHGLGDIYAMGATPHTALAIATLPWGAAALVVEDLFQMLAGALRVIEGAGATLVGGHTGEGAELALGFAMSGVADPEALLLKSGLRPGDRLVLTKPLGTGTLFAAAMRGAAKGRWIDAALDGMVQSSGAASACLRRHGAAACTDVTGFGLLGHLREMVAASGVSAALDLAALPALDGAVESLRRGMVSSLEPENRRHARALQAAARDEADPRLPLLFDPQTAGGLLAGVPAARAADCVAELRRLGYGGAVEIGEVLPAEPDVAPIRLRRSAVA